MKVVIPMRSGNPLFIPTGRTGSAMTVPNRSILDPARLPRVVRRYWIWLVVPPLVLAVGAYVLSARQPPRYVASTALVLQPTAAQERLDERPDSPVDRDAQTEQQLLNGRRFQAGVAELFGDEVEFEADAVGGTDVIELEVTAPTGRLAAEAVDEIAAGYVEQRQTQVRDDLTEAMDALQQVIGDLNAELGVVDRALGTVARDAVAPEIAASSLPRTESEASLLRRQQILVDELEAAETAVRSLESEVLLTNGDVETTGPAVVPTEPVSPRPLRTAVLWGVLGTMIGMGLVWLRDVSDRRVRSGEDMLPMAPELEFSGRIVQPTDMPETGPVSLLIEEVADRFRALAVSSVAPNGGSTVIQVVGLRGGEGATYVAVNLAVTLASGGWRTALVDADLSKGGVHAVFDVSVGPGTLDVLSGDPLSSVIGTSPMVPGLGIIPRGTPDVSPTVHNSSFTKMVNGLRTRFDAVIIDSPAFLTSGDAEVVSRHVDKTVIVAQANTSNLGDLEAVATMVRMGGGLVSGVALVEPARSVGRVSRSARSTPALAARRHGPRNGDESTSGRSGAGGLRPTMSPVHPADRRVPQIDRPIEYRNGTHSGGRPSISDHDANADV